MSVLVKDMKMPETCWECPLMGGFLCGCRKTLIPSKGRLDDCPLVEVPVPHGALVDRDALAEDLEFDARTLWDVYYRKDADSDSELSDIRMDANVKANAAAWLMSSQNKVIIEAEEE